MTAGTSKKDTEALTELSVEQGHVMRVCGTRFKGLSLSHKEWLNLTPNATPAHL